MERRVDLIHARAADAQRATVLELAHERVDRLAGVMNGDRRVAVERRAELLQYAALASRGVGARLVIDRFRDLDERSFERFDGDDSLSGSGQHFIDRKVRGDLALPAKAMQAGAGEDDAAVKSRAHFADPCIDIAAD